MRIIMSIINIKTSIVFLLCVLWATVAYSGESTRGFTIWEINFNAIAIGEYNADKIISNWPKMQWQELLGRSHIVSSFDNKADHVLRVKYPKDGVGPQNSGGQFLVKIPPKNEYYLQYRVYFEPGFDFALGGKLPGLTGGGSKATGGKATIHGEGWSARYMWRKDGYVVVYLYYPDQTGRYGEDQDLHVKFKTGIWYTLTQHIIINDIGEANGLLEVWVNSKKVFIRNNLRLRITDTPLIDTFYFSTFHGGDTPEFAPRNDSYIRFDDFILSREYIAELPIKHK